MKIDEIVNAVRAEKQTPGRFPARVIFVRNWSDYATLVFDLQKVCDVTLNLAEYANGDILPNFKFLKDEIGKHTDKTILILSLGEYLRLCARIERSKEDAEFRSIWEPDPVQSEHAKTKYIIPIFGGRELFDNAVSYVDERQRAFLWESTESNLDRDYKITVYSPDFAEIPVDADNFSEWLKNWDRLFAEKRNNFSLRTKLYKYAENSFGNVIVKVMDDPFSYITSLVTDGESLKKEYGGNQFWGEVVKDVQSNKPFVATIDYILNMGTNFDPMPILAEFERHSDTKRRLFWIRYKMYNDDNYISDAITKTNTPEEIPLAIRDAVFSITKPTDIQLADRLRAIYVLNRSYENGYFVKLDQVLPEESRLAYLSYKTHEERTYAIKTVSKLLCKGMEALKISAMLGTYYPALATYISSGTTLKDSVSSYFDWYRKGKLMNHMLDDIPQPVDVNAISHRNKVIQNIGSGYQLWIDGLGMEWLPLLMYELKKISTDVQIDYNVARSSLPSETEFNHQWGKDDEKWDRLDKLSHKGMPDDRDYHSCIAMQIECIRDIAHRVGELLNDNNCVIITGDHGSSRFAALLFHSPNNCAIDPPKNAKVRSFGRFCEIEVGSDTPTTDSMEIVTAHSYTQKKDVRCIVMKTYEHFKYSGNAAGGNTGDNAVAGEVHGGMTPEECLVPVIVVKRKKTIALTEVSVDKKRQAAMKNDIGI